MSLIISALSPLGTVGLACEKSFLYKNPQFSPFQTWWTAAALQCCIILVLALQVCSVILVNSQRFAASSRAVNLSIGK